MTRWLPFLLLCACTSELDRATGGEHPPLTEDRCRDCHVDGDAPPAPVWHVLDCCGPDHDDCGDCHRLDRFDRPTFDHRQTDFPLIDAHSTGLGGPLRCDRCHRETPTPTTCAGCHASPHRFPADACDACHDTVSFLGTRFQHDDIHPLGPQHPDLLCASCHLEPVPIRTDCSCCHTRGAFSADVGHTFPIRWRPFAAGERPADRTVCTDAVQLEQPTALDCDACHPGTTFDLTHHAHVPALTGTHAAPREVAGRQLPICDRCHLARDGTLSCTGAGCHDTQPDDL